MCRLPLFVCSLTFVLAGSLSAGDVRQVGPGQPYATIQAAVDAARTGDLVLVDPGTYPAFVIASKGVAIVAATVTFGVLTAPGVPAIEVKDLPATRNVSILGAEIHYSEASVPAVRVTNNLGAVRFSRLRVWLDGNLGSAPVRAAVQVESTHTFWLAQSVVWSDVARSGVSTVPTGVNDGISAVELWNSDGVFQNVWLRGYDNPGERAGDGLRFRDRAWLWLSDEVATADDSRFVGGNGGAYGGHALHQINFPARPDLITMCPIVDDLVGGTGSVSPGGLYGINNGNGILTFPTFTTFRIPDACSGFQVAENTLTSDTVPIGGTLSVRLWTVSSRTYATALTGRSRFGRVLSGFYGHPLVDFSSPVSVLLSAGSITGGTPLRVDTPVPPVPELAGIQFTIQTAIGSSTGFTALSAPALGVIVP